MQYTQKGELVCISYIPTLFSNSFKISVYVIHMLTLIKLVGFIFLAFSCSLHSVFSLTVNIEFSKSQNAEKFTKLTKKKWLETVASYFWSQIKATVFTVDKHRGHREILATISTVCVYNAV